MTDPARMVYQDRAYRGFKGAVKAAVRAIARFGMPVGILGWAGGHAQVMTGYVVTGQNPAVSNDFVVRYVYLSDPLRKSAVVNKRISYENLHAGPLKYRFQAYREVDSPYDDPYTPEAIRSSVRPTTAPSEWYRRWVFSCRAQRLPPESPTHAHSSPGETPPHTPSLARAHTRAQPEPTPEPRPRRRPNRQRRPTPAPNRRRTPPRRPTPSPVDTIAGRHR